MILKDFIDYNNVCPLCGEPLSFYMQLISFDGNFCLKANKCDGNTIQFALMTIDKNKIFLEPKNNIKVSLLHPVILSDFKTHENISPFNSYTKVSFFALCNSLGFKYDTSRAFNAKYEILLQKGCYYRRMPVADIRRYDGETRFAFSDVYTINECESFSITRYDKNIEKVYMCNINYKNNKTTMWHYTVNDSVRKKSFRPKTFEKDYPLSKIDMSDTDKLIKKFDSWILLT